MVLRDIIIIFAFNLEVITDTKLVFYVLWRVEHNDFTMWHDADSITEFIGFFNVLGAKNNGAGLLDLFYQLPDLVTTVNVKTGGGLI
jgi:hypothetical protein